MSPIAITGIGAVTPGGVGIEALWNGALNPPALVDGQYAIPDYDPNDYLLEKLSSKELGYLDPFSINAMVAGQMAFSMAGLDGYDRMDDVGVIIGTGAGGSGTQEAAIRARALNPDGKRGRPSARYISKMMNNAASGNLSIMLGAGGPSEAVTTPCATGMHAVEYAARILMTTDNKVMIAGSSESTKDSNVAKEGFSIATALSNTSQSMPFDRRRNGFVVGEGAGILVLEDMDHALKRGALILATLNGIGSTSGRSNMTNPSPEALRRAIHEAVVKSAGLNYLNIKAINAHGTSTPPNDRTEAEIFAELFGVGVNSPLVTSLKGAFGHPLGGGGTELVSVVESIRRRQILPIAHLEHFDPELPAINVVMKHPQLWVPGYILKTALGFGDTYAAAVFGPGQSSEEQSSNSQ